MAYYIGLMSGTSMDAVDAALLDFSGQTPRLAGQHSHPFPSELHDTLNTLITQEKHELLALGETDVQLGRLFAEAVLELLNKHDVSASEVRAIGSHGQTIFHAPEHKTPFTMQIGDPNTIAELSGITTVADFRRRDLAAGGQGAPLVPAFHNQVFRSKDKNRVILNIGGIANITVLHADENLPILGFDTGPGNTLMDNWCSKHRGTPYDQNGEWARSGKTNQKLLKQLLNDPFFQLPPPKSTGREHFNLSRLKSFTFEESPQNIQATFCQLTVESVARAIENYARSSTEVYVCGGGAHNTYLIESLKTRLWPIELYTTEKLGIPPGWVEAAAFAWLAKQTLAGKPGNLPEATGATHPVILGAIYPAGRHA